MHQSNYAAVLSMALAIGLLTSLSAEADTISFTGDVTSSTDPSVGTEITGTLTFDENYYFLGDGVHEGTSIIVFLDPVQLSLTSNGSLTFSETFPGYTPPGIVPPTASTLDARQCFEPGGVFCPGYQNFSFNGSVANLDLTFLGDSVGQDITPYPQQLTLNNFTSATYDLTYLDDSVQGSITSESFTPSPVPLPASAWLMLSGILGFGVVMRTRRE